ncbi:MAG: hypothetical protein LW850_03335 [Planctomycetaceae bacterium]|nr:hypothetical protein [Planctomycetaceae bacterium]
MVLLLSIHVAKAQEEPVNEPPVKEVPKVAPRQAWVDFSKDIAPILREHCLQCHSGPQPKGGFDISDREALLGYITPGHWVPTPRTLGVFTSRSVIFILRWYTSRSHFFP